MNVLSRLFFVLHLLTVGFVSLMASGIVTSAAQSTVVETPTVSAQLVFAQDGISQGAKTVSGAVVLRLQPGWKTYWRSPGEVGIPPQFDWEGSENLQEARHLWPAPKRFTAFGIENFGYETQVAFPVEFKLTTPGAPATFALRLDLLVCSDVCVPETLLLNHSLPTGTGLDADAAEIVSTALAKVPAEDLPRSVTSARAYVDADQTALFVSMTAAQPFEEIDLFPEYGDGTAFGKPDIRLDSDGTGLWARFPINTIAPTTGALSLTATDSQHGAFTVMPTRLAAAPEPPFDPAAQGNTAGALVWIALVAVLGGLILNVMPCVLPVLAIKVSALVSGGGQDRAQIRTGLLATTLGIMLFMWGLAAVLIALKWVGISVGWGVQFQNPLFLIVLITLLVAFVGNLFGFFEIALPVGLQTRMSHAGGTSHLGDVFTGFFAAMLATPCSAPFLGTAVAFALTGNSVDIAVTFTALGLGLALPYILLALRPGFASALPKPGRWMIWVRAAMGVLLLGTVAWLAWVMNSVAGPQATLVTLVAAGLIVALLSGAARYGRGLVLMTVPVFAATLFVATIIEPSDAAVATEDGVSFDWAKFDRSGIARHVSRGHVVFVDVTADWCVTCKANKALVLDREPIASALQADGVIAMQADWTRPDETIARFLQANNRFGIPFNAVYGPGAPEGIILPEVLRTQVILDALETARPNDLRARLRNLSEN